ncbi:hypothetical protein BROUX41_005398 [Berkeleyomyces rouxiae]|uniref:uncharacterized protein n=1 Tax=Berkeleyomyces rouxiae TaxID=2035830 RepID=UPI003B8108B6
MFTTLPGTASHRHGQADLLPFPRIPHKTLRVLCFGDSLTSGWYAEGAGVHPYSGNLYLMLGDEFPRLDVSVVTEGEPKDTVVGGSFQQRIQEKCYDVTYDWTIILGGTNDICQHTSAQDIYENLQKVWDVPLSKGKNVLALTIPETQVCLTHHLQRRDEVNRLIMQHRAEGFHAFDLHSKIPYHSLDDQSRELYWDDGVHLTEDGYDWMGGFIADELIRIIKNLQARDREAASTSVSIVSEPMSPQTPPPSRISGTRTSPSIRSTASVSANDKNTRKPGDINISSISLANALAKSTPTSLAEPCHTSSIDERISLSSSPTSSSHGSASPTYSLGSTNCSFVDHSSRMKTGDGHPFLSPLSPTRPTVRGGSLRHQPQQQSSFSHSGPGHIRSHSHGMSRGSSTSSHGRSHVHSGGVTTVRRSKRLAKRSWDMAASEDEPGVAARRLDSGYVMVHRKDVL